MLAHYTFCLAEILWMANINIALEVILQLLRKIQTNKLVIRVHMIMYTYI